jgi:Zn-dependent M28 family amino/carboxypeptidase
MRFKTLAAASAAIALSAAAFAQTAAAPDFSADRFRGHVAFLADDLLEGRNTGERGYEIAARYVATQLQGLGLKPAPNGKWYQDVPFVQFRLGDTPARMTIGDKVFEQGQQVAIGASAAEAQLTLEAPVVFVGYGIDAPGAGFNDYKGLDVKGKVVAFLNGTPAGTPSELAAHLNSEKRRMAGARGAVGAVVIRSRAEQERVPWANVARNAANPGFIWVQPDGQPYSRAPGIRTGATLDMPAAEALFAGSKTPLSRVLDEAAKPGARPKGFALRQRVKFDVQSANRTLTSPNVVAMIPGSDPALANEFVVLMAHLDHIGISANREGDKINNGALDNATGIATMLEVARAMANSPNRPRRSILFAAVTAEEKGLLGSEYLAQNPVVGNGKVVSVVNLDMPVLLYDFTDVIAFGAEHSTMGPIVRRAAAGMNIALTPDPLPEEGLFTRSDHYRFVREGVPSVFLMTGFAGEGEKQFRNFLVTNYHNPKDDMNQPINWDAGAKFARLNYLIAREIADAPEAPAWYSDSFFGKTFGKGQKMVARPAQ